MSTVKVSAGDRVRVVLEGEVARRPLNGQFVVGQSGQANHIVPTAEHVVSIEVLPPPEPEVEVFGPGDVLQSIESPTFLYTLLEDNQYLSHTYKKVWSYDGDAFTSEYYRRVELTVVPF